MKNKAIKLSLKILFHISFVVFVLAQTMGPILLANASVINSALGIQTQIGSGYDGSMYFDTKFKNMNEVNQASLEIIEETMKEGAVLLKNSNSALPLKQGDKVTLYGAASYYSVHTGQGSSSKGGALNNRVTFYQGLTNAGLDVNSELNEWYKNQGASSLGGGNFIGNSGQETQFVVKDINWNSLPSAKTTPADAAIMVLARTAGEAIDLYMDTTMDDGQTRVIVSRDNNNNPSGSVGDSLALTENEKSVLFNLKSLKDQGVISKIIVIMNSASPLQSNFLTDDAYDIDACLWVGTIGTNGANAIGKLLTGEYNPSGRTADTFWAESKYNPVYYNFGSIAYKNSSILKNYFATRGVYNNLYYVAYQEGIYNGYKYTETRYEDVLTGRPNTGEFDYVQVVTYPFGYGLSYSDFSYSNMQVVENDDDTYTVTVDVTNNSDIPGKETVQVYVQKPYTEKDIQNKVEKAAVELIGFDKVFVPANSTVTATITVQEKYFASYDANVEKTFVIGSTNSNDKYLLTAARDAHDAINNILKYKAANGVSVDMSKMVVHDGRGDGDASLVWAKYIAYDNKKYSTNEIIEKANENFTPQYEGQKANYGVDKITNQFDDVDFQKAGIFSADEASQPYMTRSNWEGTYGKRIILTANEALKKAQETPSVEPDNIEYPKYDQIGFYEGSAEFDEIKLIYLRSKDYNDPLWDTLLDRMSWEETCYLLQVALRHTRGVGSIEAPSSSQQNGALAPIHPRTYSELPSQSGFRGFAELLDPDNVNQLPPVFVCNGIVAATYNIELIERLGEQAGEEAAWAGYNGIYGLGVNIHRGAYCGRTFEYYS
jgi:beta-glucosidase